MNYRGYQARVEFDENAEVFAGTVWNADVLIAFQGKTVTELKRSFRDVVDTYLADCRTAGKAPEKPYNGTLLIRMDPALHRRVALQAAASRKSMNRYVQSLLERATQEVPSPR
jgi:predicted HicB family RNase H-like nuclease